MFFDSFFAKRAIIKILLSDEAKKIKAFGFNGVGFTPDTFPLLASYIERDKIKVAYDEKQKGSAEYDYASNTIYVGFTETSEITKKALVIHESTHALYDVVSQKMTVAVSESISYIVQCQFAKANLNSSDPNVRLNSSDANKDKVFEIAWGIAGKILGGTNPSKEDKANLIAAVSKHPYYAKNASSNAGFDGV